MGKTYTERNFLFINQGAGRYREQGAIYGVSFNEDGIAVNGMGSEVFALFAGDRGKAFRYVSPSSGLGRTLHNHVSVSIGLMSSSDRRVHFGLGAESAISSIEIRWPGGQVQTLSDVKADQILRVREPE